MLVGTDLESRRRREYVDAMVDLNIDSIQVATASRRVFESRIEGIRANCMDIDRRTWKIVLSCRRHVEKSKAEERLAREVYTCLRKKWDEEDAAEGVANIGTGAEGHAEKQSGTGMANNAGKPENQGESEEETLSAGLNGTHIGGV